MNAQHYDHDRLKEMREGRRLTQLEVAEQLEIDRQTVYRAEAGKSASYELLCDLCDLYQEDVLTLLRPRQVEAAAA
jgi:transcriptional regulator with XRE-family HTH domain